MFRRKVIYIDKEGVLRNRDVEKITKKHGGEPCKEHMYCIISRGKHYDSDCFKQLKEGKK
jgi:hypothetical protein